ncbi:NUDIX domain-containing protein [Streptomyces sp. NRRL F-5053]|uniref:NUDIX domain-containing protein n=1 Tax=Streptomyces sp. NRRL F-5053 TaxID=1463854 RepID=UPI00068F5D84|nr:NUDIX hydrolase [Streptomyces sp. NRRL F-5053]
MHGDTDWKSLDRRIGALLLIRNQRGEILLVLPSYRQNRGPLIWQLVGGGAHIGEHPTQAALREGLEETGGTVPFIVGDLLLVDYTPPSKAGSAEGYNVVFDGGVVPNDTVVTLPAARPGEAEPELLDAAFVAREQLGDYCNAAQHRRVIEALDALDDPSLRGNRFEGHRIEPLPALPTA